MKQKHINLLRAAANIMQSSMIQDENIAELKKQRLKEMRAGNIEKFDSINFMIKYAEDRNKLFLQQYADTIQQLSENDFTKLLSDDNLNPLMIEIIQNHFTPVS